MKKLLLFLFAAVSALAMSAQANLLENADFEKWAGGKPDHWTTASTAGNATLTQSTDAHGGDYAVQLTLAASNKRLGYQETVLKAGTYTFTYWAKSADGNITSTRPGYVDVDDNNTANSQGYKYGEYTNNITDWTKVEHTFTLEADTRVALVIMMPKKSEKSTASLLIDDATLTTTDGGIGGGGSEPEPAQKMTVAEAHAATAGTLASVEGTVMAVNANSTVIGDNTGYLYCYSLNTYGDNSAMAVGDVVSVQGKLAAYGGFNQMTAATATKLGIKEVAYPDPTVMEAGDLDSWVEEPEIDFVKVRGTLNISGNYYNVNFEGASTAIGSIAYPAAELKEKLSNGSTYDITGFAMYLTASKYVNIVVTDVQLVGEVVEKKDIENTPETAYTVAQAHAIIGDADSDLSQKVYVKGKVSRIQSIAGNYTNAIYFISDDGTATDELEIYQGYGVGGEDITTEDYLKVGDDVVVYGNLIDYNGTHEMNKGNHLYSLNGKTDGIGNITVNPGKNQEVYDLQGRRVARTGKGLYIVDGKKVAF